MCQRVLCKYFFAMVLFVFVTQALFPQDVTVERPETIKNGISKPNTLATHPFGLLFYTLPHNFKIAADRQISLDINLGSGNIWGQPVTTYIPTNPADRAAMANLEFYERISHFDPASSPAEVYTFQYDGIVKDLRVSATLPISAKTDLTLTARSFLLTDGKFPYSFLTGDRFIEFFHSNGLGGEDPFGRRVLGLEEAKIAYTDRNGREFSISDGEFVFAGIEAAYYVYPKILPERGIYGNLGVHLGSNLSKYNRSLDVGISAGSVKVYNFRNGKQMLVGLGFNILRRNAVEFAEDLPDLGTNELIGSFEGHIEYAYGRRNKGRHSIGLNYRLQTPYNKSGEEDYFVPFNPDRIKRWHEASRHLYKYPSYWSIIYSFTKTTEFSIYLQQDMVVNNTPDLQTGIRIRLPLFAGKREAEVQAAPQKTTK